MVGPTAKFSHLPAQRLLTLNLDAPESWLVTPTIARHDLDNIKLEDIGTNEKVLFAQFQLQHIMVEGNCFDYSLGLSPPRGLEVVLSSESKSTKPQDTIVMSNFGYYQLKSNPGVWNLHLKEGSRSEYLYKFANDDDKKVVVDSFLGSFKRLLVCLFLENFFN